MELRDAAIEDAVAIAEVHVAVWRAAYDGIMGADFLNGLSVEKRAQMWRESIVAGKPHLVLAHVGGALAGWIAFGPTRDEDRDAAWAEVLAVNVLPAYWGCGVGPRLMDVAQRRLAHEGYAHVGLWTLTGNLRAQAFYRRLGFAPDGMKKDLKMGDRTLTEVRYQRALATDIPRIATA